MLCLFFVYPRVRFGKNANSTSRVVRQLSVLFGLFRSNRGLRFSVRYTSVAALFYFRG